MNNKDLVRQQRRLLMDVEQCLHGSNALRNREDIFGNHPFGAIGAGICLSSLICMINRNFVIEADWPKAIFPELGNGNPYAWLVAWELLPIGQVIKNSPEIFNQADDWATQVYKGDDSVKFLDDVAYSVGEKVLKHIMGDQRHLAVLEPRDIGHRTLVMFKAGMEINGIPMAEAIAADQSHTRLLGFTELGVMVSTTYQYLLKRMPFAEIGNSSYITDLVDGEIYDGAMFNSIAPVCRSKGPMIGAGLIMETVHRLFGQRMSVDLDGSLNAVDQAFQSRIEASREAEADQQPAAETA